MNREVYVLGMNLKTVWLKEIYMMHLQNSRAAVG